MKTVVIFFGLVLSFSTVLAADSAPDTQIILSIQTEDLIPNKSVFVYVRDSVRAQMFSSFFQDSSCLGKAAIVSKEEIEPIDYVFFKLQVSSDEIQKFSIEELLKPDFTTPYSGYAAAMQTANRMRDWTLYNELPEKILKIPMTNCLPSASVSYLMLERTKGNCFNSTMRFFRSDIEPEETDERVITSYLENSCKKAKVDQKPFGIVGTLSNEVFLVHAFIYIGDNWVLTKNGETNRRPLQFQRLSATKQIYGPWVNREIQYFDCRN